MRTITIAISTAFQDAGDATRAIEIAKALTTYQPNDVEARIVFISHGSKFEQQVLDLGFEVAHAKPELPGVGLYQDLGMTITNLVGTEKLAEAMIQGEIEIYEKIRPDIVLHGFWPIAGVARRMVTPEIPGICFVPLPLVENFFDIIPDVPEQIKISTLFTKKVRLALFRHIPTFIKKRVPILRQNNIRRATMRLGWQKEKLVNVFDLLKANLVIVNDLPTFYDPSMFPSQVKFTGPLFALPQNDEPIDPRILEIFTAENNRPKIFCSLSSAGTEEMLKEVADVFTAKEGLNWDAVILSPHVPTDTVRSWLKDRSGIYVTDAFIPAAQVNSLADVTICHGGQGTLQTAIYANTPIVGVAAQQEQFMNLANIEARGAGIRISKAQWKTQDIRSAVSTVLGTPGYQEAMDQLHQALINIDGAKNAADAIWQELLMQQHKHELA